MIPEQGYGPAPGSFIFPSEISRGFSHAHIAAPARMALPRRLHQHVRMRVR
jgi:hypothetical protein